MVRGGETAMVVGGDERVRCDDLDRQHVTSRTQRDIGDGDGDGSSQTTQNRR